jgi:hypothetical protein
MGNELAMKKVRVVWWNGRRKRENCNGDFDLITVE